MHQLPLPLKEVELHMNILFHLQYFNIKRGILILLYLSVIPISLDFIQYNINFSNLKMFRMIYGNILDACITIILAVDQ